MPKVSILVPIFNVEKYLKECLDSIINQTLKDIEIICINDGSTDGSAAIIEEYRLKDDRIKVITKENSGYGHSMNQGLEAATGEYIGIVESDDFAEATMFEDLYNLATKHNCDLVKSEYYRYTNIDGHEQKDKSNELSEFKLSEPCNIKDCPNIINTTPSIWSAIYKREFLNERQIKFLETPGASFQDTSFSVKCFCMAETMVLTPNAYINYRQNNVTSSVKSKEKVYIICKEFEEIENYLNNYPEIRDFIKQYLLIKQYGTYVWNLRRIDDKYKNEFANEFSNIFKTYYEANEIGDIFFSKVKKKRFLMLISDVRKFEKYIAKKEQRQEREKLFSFHINSSGMKLVLFGKRVMDIG